MSDIIRLLPDSVANQIAAGEVIQRPASAVKELLENSVDSGASEIQLIIKDAGKSLIQVSDNGCGMTASDAGRSFQRHATSKITSAEDLFRIRTLGFRGEALASIAAIAQVELKTRIKGEELGTCILIEGSKTRDTFSCQCPEGTSILIKNLFFNVPARRNFLKSNTSELKHIIDEFFRVALVNKETEFSLVNNGEVLHKVNPSSFKQRIVNLFGKHFNERLVPVEHITSDLKITGFIGKPEFAKKTRGEQYFFVNGRFIKHPYLHHSVDNAFTELLPGDTVPSYFINIDLPSDQIDVNIHPTKTEVNFQDSRIIYAALRSAVRQALGQHHVMPSIDFNVEQSLDFGKPTKERTIKNPFDKEETGYNPFEATGYPPPGSRSYQQKINLENWEKLYQSDELGGSDEELQPPPFIIDPGWSGESAEKKETDIFQFQGSYIVTSIKSAMVIIDQNRAHQRILFEQYLETLNNRKEVSQQELFPQNVTFTSSDAALIDEMIPDFDILGFRLNKLGNNTFVVNGKPSGWKEEDLQGIFEKFLENFKKNLIDLNLDKNVNLARSMAANMAIKSGNALEIKVMKNLVDQLFACQVPDISPGGEKTFAMISSLDIQQLFKQ